MPNEIVLALALEVRCDEDSFGPFVAVLRVTREIAEDLIAKADNFRHALSRDDGLYEMTYFRSDVDFYESGFDDARDEVDRFIESIGESEHVEIESSSVPGESNVRTEIDKLEVARHWSRDEPETVEFTWSAVIKHTNAMIETAPIHESLIREIASRLA